MGGTRIDIRVQRPDFQMLRSECAEGTKEFSRGIHPPEEERRIRTGFPS